MLAKIVHPKMFAGYYQPVIHPTIWKNRIPPPQVADLAMEDHVMVAIINPKGNYEKTLY